MQSASAEDLETFKQLEILVTPIEYLQESVMPEADPANICIADAAFKNGPAAFVVVKKNPGTEDRPS